MKEITYHSENINIARETLIEQLKARVNPERFEHVLRVEKTAVKMAEEHEINPEWASIAALLHDYAKDMDRTEMLSLAQAYWPEGQLAEGNSAIWHGFAAAEIAQSQLGVSNPSILAAVASHTIGWYDMDLLTKIIFIADYIEPGRDFKGVDQARKLASKDLDEAVRFKMAESIQHLAKKRQDIFLESVKIYNHWTKTN